MPEHHSPIMLSQVQMKKALVYCCGIVYTVTHKTSLLSVILLVVGTNSIYHFQVCCLVLLCIFTVLLIYSKNILLKRRTIHHVSTGVQSYGCAQTYRLFA